MIKTNYAFDVEVGAHDTLVMVKFEYEPPQEQTRTDPYYAPDVHIESAITEKTTDLYHYDVDIIDEIENDKDEYERLRQLCFDHVESCNRYERY